MGENSRDFDAHECVINCKEFVLREFNTKHNFSCCLQGCIKNKKISKLCIKQSQHNGRTIIINKKITDFTHYNPDLTL